MKISSLTADGPMNGGIASPVDPTRVRGKEPINAAPALPCLGSVLSLNLIIDSPAISVIIFFVHLPLLSILSQNTI